MNVIQQDGKTKTLEKGSTRKLCGFYIMWGTDGKTFFNGKKPVQKKMGWKTVISSTRGEAAEFFFFGGGGTREATLFSILSISPFFLQIYKVW